MQHVLPNTTYNMNTSIYVFYKIEESMWKVCPGQFKEAVGKTTVVSLKRTGTLEIQKLDLHL